MIQIAPSMLAADFLHLEKDVELVNEHADLSILTSWTEHSFRTFHMASR